MAINPLFVFNQICEDRYVITDESKIEIFDEEENLSFDQIESYSRDVGREVAKNLAKLETDDKSFDFLVTKKPQNEPDDVNALREIFVSVGQLLSNLLKYLVAVVEADHLGIKDSKRYERVSQIQTFIIDKVLTPFLQVIKESKLINNRAGFFKYLKQNLTNYRDRVVNYRAAVFQQLHDEILDPQKHEIINDFKTRSSALVDQFCKIEN